MNIRNKSELKCISTMKVNEKGTKPSASYLYKKQHIKLGLALVTQFMFE